MKSKKILITGAMGFIGKHLGKKLMALGHDIFLYDKELGLDIFSVELERKIQKCDAVYHLAALTSVENSFKNPTETFRVNVLGTARVAELCMKYNKKLIYASSKAVEHPELSPYAKSKEVAEMILDGLSHKYPIVILRLANVYGERMNPDSGSVMYRFLTDKEIVVYGDGEQTRDFVSVEDVTNIMIDAMKGKWNGIAEVGTGKHYSANYVAGLFAHYRGLSGVTYKAPRREIKWSVADRIALDMFYSKKLVTNLEKDIKRLVESYYGYAVTGVYKAV